MHNTGFYRALEDRFRGCRELVKSRFEAYVPFLDALHAMHPQPAVLDLGCGRGEWLEFIKAKGWQGLGVDLDDDMLQDCRALGLDVVTGDAVEFLQSQPGQSRLLITGFHIAEHISFAQLQMLVTEALRVLQPGGLLILETPNPENITVATSSFYIDPTHEKPIPAPLLSFVAEYHGFERVKVVRLQEPHDIAQNPEIKLTDVFSYVSPDYAIVAQKNANSEAVPAMDRVFEQSYGISLAQLAGQFDARIGVMLEKISLLETVSSHQQNALERLTCENTTLKVQLQELANEQQGVVRSSGKRPNRWLLLQYALLRKHGFKQRWTAFLDKFRKH